MLQVFYTYTELLKGAMALLMLNISWFAALTTCCICVRSCVWMDTIQDVWILKRCKHFSTFLFFKEDEAEKVKRLILCQWIMYLGTFQPWRNIYDQNFDVCSLII